MYFCMSKLAVPTKGEACVGVFVFGEVARHGDTGINCC